MRHDELGAMGRVWLKKATARSLAITKILSGDEGTGRSAASSWRRSVRRMIETCPRRAPGDGYQGRTWVNHGQSNGSIMVTETPSDQAKRLVTVVGTDGFEPATLRL